jgi:hypothetical protein
MKTWKKFRIFEGGLSHRVKYGTWKNVKVSLMR